MTAQSLFKAGRLDDAIGALSAELRDNPTDAQRRVEHRGLVDRAIEELCAVVPRAEE